MGEEAYMAFEKLDADANSLNHIMEIRLEDQRFSGMIEHSSRLLELLKVL